MKFRPTYKTMYPKFKKQYSTTIEVNNSYEGETIENMIVRCSQSGEPIEDVSPTIYTERKDGVIPIYDIRTDRFDMALEAADKISAQHIASRMERLNSAAEKQEAKTE